VAKKLDAITIEHGRTLKTSALTCHAEDDGLRRTVTNKAERPK